MESEKKPKADLIAIYRLEFYRKQKCWKFSTNAKKNRRDKNVKVKNQLNKTYDITAPKTESCQLNDAFLESDPDKSATVSTSQLSHTNMPEEPKYSPYMRQTTKSTWQKNEQNHNEPEVYVDIKQRYPMIESQNICLGGNINCVPAERDCMDYNTDPENINRWPGDYDCQDMPVLNDLWCDDITQNMNGLYCGDNASNVCANEDWFRDEDMWLPADENLRWIHENLFSHADGDAWCNLSQRSTDSWAEFMRGADVAPHSSEIELTLPNDMNVTSVASLSSAQLDAAVRSHTKFLRCLLQEESLRRRNRSRLSLTAHSMDRSLFSPRPATVNTDYERPTRDNKPSSPHHTALNTLQRERTFTKTFDDVLIAGSHRNGGMEILGRGRGRLQCVTGYNDHRVVGVGRGRPVRL